MKIGILTHPLGANYGGVLQAWALMTYLTKQGHDVYVLNRQPDLPVIKRFIKALLMLCRHPRYNNPRYKHLRLFIQDHINYSQPLMTSSQMKDFVTKKGCEAIIVGSDQVWRSSFAMGYGYNYFMDFVPENIKKLSYAASFGLSDWSYTKKQTLRIKELVSSFDSVSVREDEGVELCRINLNISAEHVLDPTMLLSPEDYDNIITHRIVEEDYVFVYWLGSEEEKQEALKEYNTEGKRIIDISLRGTEPLIPIEDWLSYIKYADAVITDSFHGCVFSILFKKKFKICSNKLGGNGRMNSLFKMLDVDLYKENLDYSKISAQLQYHRLRSYEFLNNSLR